nr:site-specific integrase [Belnapia moabensis]
MLSLRTRRYREAEHRAGLVDEAFGSAWERAVAAGMSDADIKRVLRQYLQDALAEDMRERLATSPGRPVYPSGWDGEVEPAHHDREMITEGMALAEEALAERDFARVADTVGALMATHDLREEVRPLLSLGVLQANVQMYRELEKRITGRALELVESEPPAPLPPPLAPAEPLAAPEAAVPAKPKVSELVEPYFNRRETLDRTTHQVMNQERGTVTRFMEVCGDRPVDAYHRGDISSFLDTLRRLPATYGKSPKDKDRSLVDIIAEAHAKGAERLTDKTVKRHLSALSQFFQFAVDLGHLANSAKGDLVENHRFRVDRSARKQRDAWTSEELARLFTSPVWTGCHPVRRAEAGPEIIRDARFWLPLLALFHGARLEEFADLYRRDIGCDEGVWFVRITETEGRRLKTANAERVVPLHPEVIRLGFLDHVRTTAPNPGDPLFPDLEPQGKDRKRGPRITRWFVEYRKAIGIYREGVGMHAFRHTVRTRLSNRIRDVQQERHVDFMLGHGRGGSEGRERYDKGPGLKATAETLALLQYPELDLAHLYTRQREGVAA